MRHRHPHSLLRLLGALFGVTLVFGAVPPRVAGQDRPTPSATLLRRVAEAVDGQRDGRQVWVVVQPQAPFDVRGVYRSQTDAITAAAMAPSGFIVLGPYLNPPDSGTQSTMMSIEPCPGRHAASSGCTDTSANPNSAVEAIAADSVDSVVVFIFGRRHTPMPIRRSFRRGEVDAVFLTLSAIDKFVMPYYTRLYGPAVAARMRADYLQHLTHSH